MEINSFEQAGKFELTGELTLDAKYFKAINPFFFNFFKRTSDPAEVVEPLSGVTIEWQGEAKQPLVTIEGPRINSDGQLFLQMYGDQMVELR